MNIGLQKHNKLFIKEEHTNSPFVSGNKLHKLKYNLAKARALKKDTLITFGGAFSNHIAATAYAGKINNFNTIAFVRGEELQNAPQLNPTLQFAQNCGMNFNYISRAVYRLKDTPAYLETLQKEYPEAYIIPEGGSNDLAVMGCEEILTEEDNLFDYICCPIGTGGTISGIINSSKKHQTILGFPAFKGHFDNTQVSRFTNKTNWKIISDYHFGGYGRVNEELIVFLNEFYKDSQIPLDPIYTGKMVFGVIDLINKGFFPKNAKILAIHTGGLQGIKGMNEKLKKEGKTQLIYEN